MRSDFSLSATWVGEHIWASFQKPEAAWVASPRAGSLSEKDIRCYAVAGFGSRKRGRAT